MDELLKELTALIDKDQIKFNKNTVAYRGAKYENRDFLGLFSDSLSDASGLTVFKTDPTVIINKLKSSLSKGRVEIAQGTPLASPKLPLLIPAADVRTFEKKLLDVEGRLTNFNYDLWESTLDKDAKGLVSQSQLMVVFDYDPHEEDLGTTKVDNFEVKRVNLYKKPEWRKLVPFPSRDGVEELPGVIQEFFDHLFVDSESREYVLDWMYYMITSRMEVALVVNGAKGVGKGILGNVLQSLVGADNHKVARVNILDTNFNSDFQNNQLIEFDEVKITRTKTNHLKLYFNSHFSIEVKGVDGSKSIKNHNSFYISANGAGDLYVKSDDRRFSILDVTTTPLLDIMTETEINALKLELEDPSSEIVAQLGDYILKRGAKLKYGNFRPYKTQRFHDLVENSLSGWEKFVHRHVINKGTEVPIDRLRKKYNESRKTYPLPESDSPVIEFFRDFRNKEGEQIAYTLDGKVIPCNMDENIL